MNSKSFFALLIILLLFAGCNKEKYEDFTEPEPINTLYYSDSDDNGSNGNDNNEKNQNSNNEKNLLKNGGLEEWEGFWTPDMPKGWSLPSNDYVKRNYSAVYEGKCSAIMRSLEKGKTARLEQAIPVTPQQKIRIRFHYAVTQWKDKGARTFCYFRTRAAEASSISAGVLQLFYDEPTYRIIRGGGYGLTYFPHELNKWLSFDETIEVPPTATYFAFGINSYYGTTLYVDDCWIIDVTH